MFGHCEKLQTDPHFNEYILFHEYFHGDNGRGIGASHQTGWTGLIAKLIQPYGEDERSDRKKKRSAVELKEEKMV